MRFPEIADFFRKTLFLAKNGQIFHKNMQDSPIFTAFLGVNPWFLSIYAFMGLKLDFWQNFGQKTDFHRKGVPLLIT